MRPCMDADDWDDWEALNRRLLAADERAQSPCEDCTVRYAVEMRLLGRCDGWPADRPEGRPWKRTADERRARLRASWRESKARQRARAMP